MCGPLWSSRLLLDTLLLLRADHFNLEFLELEQALDLKFLGINKSLAILVYDVDIGKQVLYDALELRVRNLEQR